MGDDAHAGESCDRQYDKQAEDMVDFLLSLVTLSKHKTALMIVSFDHQLHDELQREIQLDLLIHGPTVIHSPQVITTQQVL